MKNFIVYILVIFSFGIVSCSQNKTTTIYLVRHAEKMKGGEDPELNVTGIKRAEKLSYVLKDIDLSAVYSTDYKRTRNTARPTASSKNLEVIIYDPEGQDYFASKIVQKYKGDNVLIVGHSNTIPMLVNELIESEDYEQLDDQEYDKLFVVSFTPDGNVSVKMETY